jgi:hypothetical protein
MNVENMKLAIQFFRDLNERRTPLDGTELYAYSSPDGAISTYGIWDMTTWGISNKGSNEQFNRVLKEYVLVHSREYTVEIPKWAEEHDCGTVNCALGWLAISGVFPGASFQYGEWVEANPTYEYYYGGFWKKPPSFAINDQPIDSAEFARIILGLKYNQFNRLFMTADFKTPGEAADKMQKMVDDYVSGMNFQTEHTTVAEDY